ncbi:MAG: hypothetical protein GY804_07550 [Alphaproteobacteria bacterium]|nr:hypothetical protein [Alphaproteobacteria bacterium]
MIAIEDATIGEKQAQWSGNPEEMPAAVQKGVEDFHAQANTEDALILRTRRKESGINVAREEIKSKAPEELVRDLSDVIAKWANGDILHCGCEDQTTKRNKFKDPDHPQTVSLIAAELLSRDKEALSEKALKIVSGINSLSVENRKKPSKICAVVNQLALPNGR